MEKKSGDEDGGASKKKEGKSCEKEKEHGIMEEETTGMNEKEKKEKDSSDLIDLTGKSPVRAGSHVDKFGQPLFPRVDAGPNDSANCPKESEAMETDKETGTEEDSEAANRTITDGDSEARKQRRKRRREKDLELSPVLSEGMDKLMAEIDRLCGEAEKMKILTKENINTKREVKEKANHMANLAKGILKVKNSIAFRAPTEPYRFEAPLRPKSRMEVEPCSSLTVQSGVGKEDLLPVYCEKCKEEVGKEERLTKEIVQDLDRVEEMDETEMKTLFKTDWPIGAYKATKVKQGKITKETVGAPAVVMITAEETQKLILEGDNWIDRMTGLAGLLNKVSVRKNKPLKCSRQSTVRLLEEEEHDEPAVSEVYVILVDTLETKACLEAVGSVCRNIEAKNLNVATVGNVDTKLVRKLYEAQLRGTEKVATMIVTGGKALTEMIVVKTTTGKTFAELVKGVKDAVGPGECGGIKNLRKTKDGDVMLLADKNMTERLMKDIEGMDGVKTCIGGRKQIEIMDLDPTVLKEEISEAVKRVASREEMQEVAIDGLRGNASGFQIAVLTVPKRLGERLLRDGNIRIGWTSCRVKERVNIDRCLNCLRVGHQTARCPDPRNDEKRCLRCTKVGHIAKDCNVEAYCGSCKVQGHRNDSFSCPIYRDLVQKKRERK